MILAQHWDLCKFKHFIYKLIKIETLSEEKQNMDQ